MNTFLLASGSTDYVQQKRPVKGGGLSLSHSNLYLVRCWLLALILLTTTGTAGLAQDLLLGLTSAGGQNGGGTAFSIRTNGTSFAVHQKFMSMGYYPSGDLVKGTDGNFYGMVTSGGSSGYGTIFKMSSTGSITILRSLAYSADGAYPYGSLLLNSDGNFYGMTSGGGGSGYGTIFKFSPTGTYTVLRTFIYASDGGKPQGNLVKGNDGNFYGMTYQGGTYGYGTIFKVTPTGTYTVLRHLNNTTTGSYPYGSLVKGTDGNFYGMTYQGGTNNYGTIFKITPSGTFTVLRNLAYATDGANPYGSLIQGTDGSFYGMTYYGGVNGYGTVFKISSTGTFKIIKGLDYYNTGGYPRGRLSQGADGNFYGLTGYGGNNGAGTIFKVTPAGTLTVLRHLTSTTDGANPRGSLYKNSDGSFYGMTYQGGGPGYGTIFKITSTGTFTVLVRLPDGNKGLNPQESLIQAKNGNFYGMAYNGGTYGVGTIFKLCTSGSYSTLKSFNYGVTGGSPRGSLVQGTDGNFYGMTYAGGTSGYGTVFKLSASGSTLTIIRHLTSATGGYPEGGLVQGNDGNFYGMGSYGGSTGYGTIFKITPTGTLTVLRNLNHSTDGYYPKGSLIKGTDGNFYGMTYAGGSSGYGTIFKITSLGAFTVLKVLNYSTNGGYPEGSLVQGPDGNFYGMTQNGGSSGLGTIFKMTPSGTFTVLRNLISSEGYNPKGSLVRGSDGAYYGLTSKGGTYAVGTIFRITTSGTFTVLRHLKPATDGSTPLGSLVIRKANPVANSQSVTTAKNTAKSITLTGSGGTPLIYTVATGPSHGTLSGSGATRTYTPATNYTGTDAFTFYVTWGCQKSAIATVKITVTATSLVAQTSVKSVSDEQVPGTTSLFPNPVRDKLTVNLDGPADRVKTAVIGANGAIMPIDRPRVTGPQTLELNVTPLQPGFYILQLQTDSRAQTLKFIKE